MWWSWKKRFLTVSIFGGCGGLEITETVSKCGGLGRRFLTVSIFGGCGGLEITDF